MFGVCNYDLYVLVAEFFLLNLMCGMTVLLCD